MAVLERQIKIAQQLAARYHRIDKNTDEALRFHRLRKILLEQKGSISLSVANTELPPVYTDVIRYRQPRENTHLSAQECEIIVERAIGVGGDGIDTWVSWEVVDSMFGKAQSSVVRGLDPSMFDLFMLM